MTGIVTAFVALGALAAVLSSAVPAAADSLDRALSLAAEGRHGEARQALDPLLESEPVDPQARLLHGILRVQEGIRGEAIAVFSGLVREFPDMFEAHNNLAVVYVEEGRLEEARAVLASILERRPKAVGYRNLGDIYERLARRAYAESRALGGKTVDDSDRDPGRGLLHADDAAGAAPEVGTVPERASGAEPPALRERPAPAGAAPAGICVATGEFRDMGAAERARRWLASMGAVSVRVTRGSRETVRDYRVYLPPFESRSGAREKLRELSGKGVRDVAVILSGALKNAVSLGVYAREANASRRVARLEALGYAPVVEPNTTAVEEHATVEARLAGGFEALSAAWSARFPDRPVREVDCD